MAAGRQLKDIFNYIGCFPCSRNFALTSIKELSKNSQSNNNITQSDESDNNKEDFGFC